MSQPQTFEITLGRFRTLSGVRRAFKGAGCYVHPRATEMLRMAVCVARRQRKISVIARTVEALGFPNGATYQELSASLKELCPAEVGPLVRLAYLHQSGSEQLHVAMQPMTNVIGNPFIFTLVRPFGTPLLYCEWAFPYTRFHKDDVCIVLA